MRHSFVAGVAVLFAVSLAAVSAQAAPSVWTLAGDWNLSKPQTGIWRYYSTLKTNTDTAQYHLLDRFENNVSGNSAYSIWCDNTNSTAIWDLPRIDRWSNLDAVRIYTEKDSNTKSGSGTIVIEWTAPEDGQYTISGIYSEKSTGDSNFKISTLAAGLTTDNTYIFTKYVSGTQDVSFELTQNLIAGTRVYFRVDPNVDAYMQNDYLSATITRIGDIPIPEPAVLGMMGASLPTLLIRRQPNR